MEVRTHMYVHKYFKHFNSYIATGQFCKRISNGNFYLNTQRLSQWEYSMKLLYQTQQRINSQFKQCFPREWRVEELDGIDHSNADFGTVKCIKSEQHLLKGWRETSLLSMLNPCLSSTFLWHPYKWMKFKFCFLSNASTLQKQGYL